MAIPISETFSDPLGRLQYYDAYDVLENEPMAARQHVNVRSFSTTTSEVSNVESWTTGTIGADPAYGNRNTLRLALTIGANSALSTGDSIDVASLPDDWFLSISLPNFPGASIDRNASFLDLGSTTLPLTSLPTTSGTNVELVFATSSLPQNFTDVNFRFQATAATTVTVAALRLLSPGWTVRNIDVDTQTKRLSPTFRRDGSLPTAPEESFPQIWRASIDDPGGADDPRPVNSKLGVNFFTGSKAGGNQIELFFRGRREDYITQLDLDGTDPGITPSYGENQTTLDARKRQPDYGQARYDPRPQEDLEGLTQAEIDAGDPPTRTQASMERLVDTISASWVKVQLNFGAEDSIELSTTETLNDEERYRWLIALSADTFYTILVDLIDSTVQIRIFEIAANGSIDYTSPVFDSSVVKNDFTFKRRRGRIGWQILLTDGDAYIESIRSRGQMYGEILTNNFESFTPVIGARISTGGTPDQIIIPFTSAYAGATIAPDTRITRSTDGSVKVTAGPGQGVQTDWYIFEDFENTEIFFDLYVPNGAAETFQPSLLNEKGMLISLGMGRASANRWQTFRIYTSNASVQMSGRYRFVLAQSTGHFTWNIDNLYIKERSIAYAGRSEPLDPWGRGGNPWTEFKSLINNDSNGVIFPTRGNYCQIRAQALKQGVTIDKIYVKPQYAQLGRFTWNS